MEVFELIADDSPHGFIPGSFVLGEIGLDEPDYAENTTSLDFRANGTSYEFDGFFTPNPIFSQKCDPVLQIYTTDGKRASTNVNATGYFRVKLFDLIEGSH